MKTVWIFVGILAMVRGHGRLWDPPSRSSMWRRGYATPPNYNDNELNCGGFALQWFTNGGKCGICGDPFSESRPNEAGGKYAQGVITRKYSTGQTIDIDVDVTANHLGWFEFRVCPNNNFKKAATQDCLDQYVLQKADGTGTKYDITSAVGHFHMKYKLPASLVCAQCVLQWKWHAGNSWGTDPDGTGGMGRGAQEEFYGCSDVAIEGHGVMTSHVPVDTTTKYVNITSTSIPTTHNPTTQKPTTSIPTTPKPTTPKPTTSNSKPTTPKPTTLKPTTQKPTTQKPTTSKHTTPKPTTLKPTTQKPTTQKPTTPKPTTPKPTTLKPTTQKPTTQKPTTQKPTATTAMHTSTPQPSNVAVATSGAPGTQGGPCTIQVSDVYSRVPGMLQWCKVNCAAGFCPQTHCVCV